MLQLTWARRAGLAFVVFASLATQGCGKKALVDSMDNMKELSMALLKYDAEHNAWPDSLDQIKPLIGTPTAFGVIGKGKDFATLMKNPVTGDNPGYEYVKPKDASAQVMLYQLRDGKRDTSLVVAYTDTSVRMENSPP